MIMNNVTGFPFFPTYLSAYIFFNLLFNVSLFSLQYIMFFFATKDASVILHQVGQMRFELLSIMPEIIYKNIIN